MMWLWYVGPIAIALVYFLTGLPGRHERRRAIELARWRGLMAPKQVIRRSEGYRGMKETKVDLAGPREVPALPGDLYRLLPRLGGGVPIAFYELIEKLAYVAVMGPDHMNGSEYQTVLAKLEHPAPAFTVRPLPIVEGRRVPNTGVQFKKDPGFMDLFLVEGGEAKKIGRWLPRSLRDALRELPDAWLYVQGRAMALVLYGPVDADRMFDLITLADTIFAEHGAEGGPSLFFDEDEEDDGDGDEDGDGAEGDDGERDEDEEKAADASNTAKPATAVKTPKGAPAALAPKKAEKQPAKATPGRTQ